MQWEIPAAVKNITGYACCAADVFANIASCFLRHHSEPGVDSHGDRVGRCAQIAYELFCKRVIIHNDLQGLRIDFDARFLYIRANEVDRGLDLLHSGGTGCAVTRAVFKYSLSNLNWLPAAVSLRAVFRLPSHGSWLGSGD
jgi:hypothetical protein